MATITFGPDGNVIASTVPSLVDAEGYAVAHAHLEARLATAVADNARLVNELAESRLTAARLYGLLLSHSSLRARDIDARLRDTTAPPSAGS